MKKVIIIGCPGSGKSTFARALREITKLPLIYLDMLFWNADGTSVSREVFLQRLEEAMAGDRWIIDGNYSTTMERRLAACDTVFVLDYPVQICLDGAKRRRGTVREDIPWVEPTGIPEEEEFYEYIRNFEKERRPGMDALLAQYSDRQIIRFCSREQAGAYLECLRNSWEEP